MHNTNISENFQKLEQKKYFFVIYREGIFASRAQRQLGLVGQEDGGLVAVHLVQVLLQQGDRRVHPPIRLVPRLAEVLSPATKDYPLRKSEFGKLLV